MSETSTLIVTGGAETVDLCGTAQHVCRNQFSWYMVMSESGMVKVKWSTTLWLVRTLRRDSSATLLRLCVCV